MIYSQWVLLLSDRFPSLEPGDIAVVIEITVHICLGLFMNSIGERICIEELAKQLRQNSTLSEVLLWNQLKNKQLFGLDFDRQNPLGSYIVDFYCKKLMLTIKIDGDSNQYKHEEDIAQPLLLSRRYARKEFAS
jgi:hypothetical protein